MGRSGPPLLAEERFGGPANGSQECPTHSVDRCIFGVFLSQLPRDREDNLLPAAGRGSLLLPAISQNLPELRLDPVFTFGPKDYVSKHILRDRAWDRGMLQKMRSVLAAHKDSVLLDLGLNIGVYSLVAAAEGHEVLAFEMMESAYYKAAASAQENGIADRVRLFCLAIGNTVGEHVEIVTATETNEGNTVAKVIGGGGASERTSERHGDDHHVNGGGSAAAGTTGDHHVNGGGSAAGGTTGDHHVNGGGSAAGGTTGTKNVNGGGNAAGGTTGTKNVAAGGAVSDVAGKSSRGSASSSPAGVRPVQGNAPACSTANRGKKCTTSATLDFLLDQNAFSTLKSRRLIVKIDVEGHECAVLDGAEKFLRTTFGDQIDWLQIEVRVANLKCLPMVRERLKKAGLSEYNGAQIPDSMWEDYFFERKS